MTSSLIDTTTLGLTTLLLAAWWFKPARPSNLSFRLNRLRRQSVAGPVRLPKETAVYRSGSHDVPLVRDIPASALPASAGGGDQDKGLWAVVTSQMKSAEAAKVKIGEVGGDQLTYAQAYARITRIGSGLHHLLSNGPQTLLDLCSQPSLLSDLTRLACLGFGIHLATASPNLGAIDSSTTGAILVSAHDLARLADLQIDNSISVIVMGDLSSAAGKDAERRIERLIPMADVEDDGAKRPVDVSPLATDANWVDEFTPADFLAVLGGLASPPARDRQENANVEQVVVIERNSSSIASFIFLLHHLSSPTRISILLLTSPTAIDQPSLLLGLHPTSLILCTPLAISRLSDMLNQFATTWLAHASFPHRHLALQHLATARASGIALEWSDLLAHQQWALAAYRNGVLGGNLASVTLLAMPTGDAAQDWTWAILGGVRIQQVWGPQSLLGCVTVSLPLTVPGGGLAGGVLAHAVVKLVAGTEDEAARREGEVCVSTATRMGGGGREWVRTGVRGRVDGDGALWIV